MPCSFKNKHIEKRALQKYHEMFIKYVFFTFLSFYVGYASSACSTIHEQGTTQADEDFIVNKHNELRLTIAKGTLAGQPRGINLKRLQYSKILGEKAQEIANSCELAHKPVNGTQWNWVANNLFIYHFGGFNKGADWNSAIQGWWDEHKNYKFGTPPAENTGHYTQLAWANTDHIGCGYTHFEDNDPKYKYHKLYVCNYAPGGNIAGQNPYQTGNSGCENLC